MNRAASLAAVALGAVVTALSFPSTDAGFLAWFGLVPLLLAVRGRSVREAFGLGWLFGLVLYLIVLYWISPTISNFTRITPMLAHLLLLLLVAVVGLFTAGFAAAVEWIAAAGISRVIAAPLVWVVIEYSRSYIPAAFPWALLGYSQYGVEPVIQIADIGGVYLVSATLVFINAVLAEVATDGPRRHGLLLTASAAVVVIVFGYGSLRAASVADRLGSQPAASLRVGLVQGNIRQDRKWDRSFEEEILATHLALTRRAIDDGAGLVVWPEAAVPFALRLDPRAAQLVDLSRASGARLLVGAPGIEVLGPRLYRQYNRAWLIDPEVGLAGSYDKIQLVPFGEYVPFGWLLWWVDQAVQAIGNFGRGSEYVVFELPADVGAGGDVAIGVSSLICYEGIFPALTRNFVAAGARLLVNISNDAWYGRTSAPHQHLAMAAVRAVENRVPVVRATNTGVSAFVDAVGRIRGRTPLFEEAVAVDDVVIADTFSLYRTLGDWFVYLCMIAVAALAALRMRLGSVLIRERERGILPSR